MSSTRKQYPFHLIEPKWQKIWEEQQTFRAWNPGETIPKQHPFSRRHKTFPPKYYILDMFPYPSGAGLHVGHPEGYTATDILARYRRALGFNVLHPMGWDAFGLPAEQYAIKTGQHPRVTTEANIATFKRQIKSLGFSYDWSREIDTTDPKYFKWTQWIFLKLYNAWFNPKTNKAEPIETLEFPDDCITEAQKRHHRAGHRLAKYADAPVWWCEELGTVLANEEVIEGKSEVGGFPVVRKLMRQWMLRITEYAERLLEDLDTIDWSHSLKAMQRNWIGRSDGATVYFDVYDETSSQGAASVDPVPVFTTRPDTLFGATYMVLAPEHSLVEQITTPACRKTVEGYREFVATKSDLERTELAKEKTGVFTGAYAVNPANGERIPIWIADYVLLSYGTGAIMAVPAHDERDFEFAKKFGLNIWTVIEPSDQNGYTWKRQKQGAVKGGILSDQESWVTSVLLDKVGKVIHQWDERKAFTYDGVASQCLNSTNEKVSLSLDGLPVQEAKKRITDWLILKGLGERTINYKLRDWLFSRQRYWGEPFPIIWRKGEDAWYPEALPESELPVLPPPLDDYKPTPDGQPPLARAKDWVNLPDGSQRETNTMPQWAGSCWYYLRFLDAQNESVFCGKPAEHYWMGVSGNHPDSEAENSNLAAGSPLDDARRATPGVDLYVGGTEHAVLHLLYARFWHKVLFDLDLVSTREPFFKLVNQGLILGEDGQKMSKSRGNVVNPDDILAEFGADAFRLYEMFMGPIEMVKPWNTKGVEGVYRFLGRVWRLLVDEKSETNFEQALTVEDDADASLLQNIQLSSRVEEIEPTPAQLKTLHACIKKVTEDLEGLRFNTAISALMTFVNEAITWGTKPRPILRDFLTLLQPFAPHLAEELFAKLEANRNPEHQTLAYLPWPSYDPALLVEDTLEIPVQVNGKLRDRITVPADATQKQLEAAALSSEKVRQFIDGKTIKKIIVVPKKLVNIVVG